MFAGITHRNCYWLSIRGHSIAGQWIEYYKNCTTSWLSSPNNFAPITLHGKIRMLKTVPPVEWLAIIPLSVINAFLIGIAFINLIIVGITCNKFPQVSW